MSNLNFRAWHKELKEMEPVLLMCFVNQYVNVLPARNLEGGSQEQWDFKDVVLMKSTGIIDRNGFEVFDGDFYTILGGGSPSEVIFDEYKWFARGIDEKTGRKRNYEIFEMFFKLSEENIKNIQLEVVGDIYQNPELLGVGE